ncbi:MAG: M50 family metallopeptidase [Anaerolineales bacterium]|nr:M50 family metallopeptidase [Anaerolineales bacterium]
MDQILEAFIGYLAKVGVVTASQMFILLGPGLVLAFVMFYVSDILRRQTAALFGYNFWVYFTAIGTVVHELGHALFAWIFGHKVIDIELFNPDPYSGSLGSVSHLYNRRNIFQVIGNFFVGIGPILLGSLVIFLASRFLIGPHLFLPFSELSLDTSTLSAFDSLLAFVEEVFNNALQVFSVLLNPDNYNGWQLIVFLYITLAVGAHLKLSLQDLQSAWIGFIALLGLVFAFNFVTLWMGDVATRYIVLISQSYSFFYAIMIFAMVLNSLFIVLFSLLLIIKAALNR